MQFQLHHIIGETEWLDINKCEGVTVRWCLYIIASNFLNIINERYGKLNASMNNQQHLVEISPVILYFSVYFKHRNNQILK